MKSKIIFCIISLLLLFDTGTLVSQQNHTMYIMHYLPESNLLNPAVPISCKWYIGIPVLSSLHLNYANSSFSYNTLFKNLGNGVYETDIDKAVKKLHFRNLIGTELHAQLLAIGYRKDAYSFMFTITEKNNIPVIYPKKPILLAWKGNSQFEGEKAGFRGTSIYFNHYREYALGVSKYAGKGIYYGLKAKLLFGKLDLNAPVTNVNVYTDPTTFNLTFDGNMKIRSSLPIVVDITDNQFNSVSYNDNVSPLQLVLNRKNPGFALDAGIIYPYSEKIEISASVIDLGFIRWRSNLNVIEASGNFFYDGPFGDSVPDQTYFGNLLDAFTDSMNMTVSQEKYTSFLPPRLLVGATYDINEKIKAGLQSEAIFYKTKIIPSITLSAQAQTAENIHFIASYSLQYYSIKSFGLGFVLGRNPVQFYMISDDVPAMIWPLSARNINLRFGLNINLGCNIRENSRAGVGKGQLQGNCYWLEKEVQKEIHRSKRKK